MTRLRQWSISEPELGAVLAPLAALPPVRRPRSLYVHVPFCFHKCHYCDFYSIVDSRDRQDAFADRLCQELCTLAPLAGPLETIFVGGGTPTLLRADLWKRVLETMHDALDLTTLREFTVECNPETATPGLMGVLHAGGVNRVSIGAQSFDPRHLKTLERWHDPGNVAIALDLARDAGIERRSIDLIYAIPGQTPDDWERDLDTALALGVTHMSCYNLTYEPNTAMTKRLERGDFEPTDEDTEIAMYDRTVERLRAAGLERYEVSNFATPGQECAHNLAYWRQDDWLTAGPSASGHVAGRRWRNIPRLDTYLASEGLSPVTDHEEPDARRNLSERIMTSVRLREGLDHTELTEQADHIEPGLGERLTTVVNEQIQLGRLHEERGRWSLTDAGYLFADGVARALMAVF